MPRLRIPLWAAVAIPAAAYVVRAITRGYLAPDLPGDAVVLGVLMAVLLLAAFRQRTADEHRDELTGEMDGGHDPEGGER